MPYLGYGISAEGILPNPDNILAVKEFLTPANRGVREFQVGAVIHDVSDTEEITEKS